MATLTTNIPVSTDLYTIDATSYDTFALTFVDGQVNRAQFPNVSVTFDFATISLPADLSQWVTVTITQPATGRVAVKWAGNVRVDPGVSISTAASTATTVYAFTSTGRDWTVFPSSISGVASDLSSQYASMREPRPVIIDTDWWTDTSDIAGLRSATVLEQMGAIDIKAVTIDVTYSTLPSSLDAFLVWDNRRRVPIGKSHTSHTPSGTPPTYPAAFDTGYDHDVALSQVPDAVTLMRQVIAASEVPVHIVAIGYLNNIADLLESEADDASDLTGAELVAENGTVLWAAAGIFPSGEENNLTRTATASAAGATVATTWPSTLYWFGAEIGAYAMSGGILRTTYPDDLLWVGYYNQQRYYGRPSWDNMCITACALDQIASGEYTTVRGTCTVNPSTGANTWVTSADGPHYYLVKAHSDYYYECQQAALMVPPYPRTTKVTGAVMPTFPQQVAAGAITQRDGADVPLEPTRLVRVRREATTDDPDLLMHFHADDLAAYTTGTNFPVWNDRQGNFAAKQIGTTDARPQFRTGIGGKNVVSFFGGDGLITDPMVSPSAFTLYAWVYFVTVPSAAMTIATWETQNTGGTYPPKHGRLIINASGKPAALRFEQLSAITDTAADAISSTTWTKLAYRYDPATAKAEVFVDGVGTGGTALSGGTFYANGALWVPFTIGGRYSDNLSSEPLNSNIHEMRVYSVAHSNAEITAVLADMT